MSIGLKLNNNRSNLKWNREWLITHTLDRELIDDAEIELLESNEIFIEVPGYPHYYVSQFGRAISLKRNTPYLLGATLGGQSDRRYLYYCFSNDGNKNTISVHHAVAITFCPNFWGAGKRLEAHHLDGEKMHNEVENLILLPTNLHAAIHKIKEIVLLDDRRIIPYKNPLDLVADTGLTLEDILLANKGKNKPVKSQGGYTVFNIKGYLIGFKYYPESDKKKKTTK